MYYVYVLKSQKDKRLYIGYTDDLRLSFLAHSNGQVLTTKERLPLKLVYYEAYDSMTDAKKRNNDLKLFGSSYARLKRRIKQSAEDKIDSK